jgi:hypothetical protein
VDVIAALEHSYGQTAELATGLTAAQLDAPSPCAGWDVRATLNHLLGTTWMFTLVSWRQPPALEGDRSSFAHEYAI